LAKSEAAQKKADQEVDLYKRRVRDLELEKKSADKSSPATTTKKAAPAAGKAEPSGKTQPNALGSTNVRCLSLKQLKDMIVDMYSSKVKFDKKCEDAHLARETMEQFMYTYLNQKYGLKSLIVEWAAAIINGVKRHIRADHDVSLFAKILKNECDEEFRFIQAHVKSTLMDMVKAMMKDKYPLKSEGEITKMLEKVKDNNIEDWMWQKILEKMYEERDASELQDRIRKVIDDRQ